MSTAFTKIILTIGSGVSKGVIDLLRKGAIRVIKRIKHLLYPFFLYFQLFMSQIESKIRLTIKEAIETKVFRNCRFSGYS